MGVSSTGAVGLLHSDGVRAVCWGSRAFAERLPSTFAERAERAYARSRDQRNEQRNEQRQRVGSGALRPEPETQLMLRAAGGGGRSKWHSA